MKKSMGQQDNEVSIHIQFIDFGYFNTYLFPKLFIAMQFSFKIKLFIIRICRNVFISNFIQVKIVLNIFLWKKVCEKCI